MQQTVNGIYTAKCLAISEVQQLKLQPAKPQPPRTIASQHNHYDHSLRLSTATTGSCLIFTIPALERDEPRSSPNQPRFDTRTMCWNFTATWHCGHHWSTDVQCELRCKFLTKVVLPKLKWCCSPNCCNQALTEARNRANQTYQDREAASVPEERTTLSDAFTYIRTAHQKKVFYHIQDQCLSSFGQGLGRSDAMCDEMGEQRLVDFVPEVDMSCLPPGYAIPGAPKEKEFEGQFRRLLTYYQQLFAKRGGRLSAGPYPATGVQQYNHICQAIGNPAAMIPANEVAQQSTNVSSSSGKGKQKVYDALTAPELRPVTLQQVQYHYTQTGAVEEEVQKWNRETFENLTFEGQFLIYRVRRGRASEIDVQLADALNFLITAQPIPPYFTEERRQYDIMQVRNLKQSLQAVEQRLGSWRNGHDAQTKREIDARTQESIGEKAAQRYGESGPSRSSR